MPALAKFIRRKGAFEESICSNCCQVVGLSPGITDLQMAHRCGEFSLNTVTRGCLGIVTLS